MYYVCELKVLHNFIDEFKKGSIIGRFKLCSLLIENKYPFMISEKDM